MVIKASIICWTLLCVLLANARSDKDYFTHYTTKQGLFSNTINVIVQDQRGFIWLGTQNGLYRFDGTNFIQYAMPEDSVTGSEDQSIVELVTMRDGGLLLAVANRGFFFFESIQERFTHFTHHPDDTLSLSHNGVQALCQDRKGMLWIGSDNGLNRFNPADSSLALFRVDPVNPDGPENEILTLFEDREGRFWIGTANGVCLFDRNTEKFTRVDLQQKLPEGWFRKISCFREDRDGNIWIGSMWGLFKFNPRTQETEHFIPPELAKSQADLNSERSSLSNAFISDLEITRQEDGQVLWIATQWGLNRLDLRSGEFTSIVHNMNNPRGLSGNFLLDLCISTDGLLWIGTYSGGLNVLDTRANPFHYVQTSGQDQEQYFKVSCFLDDADGSIWIGGTGIGLVHYDAFFEYIDDYSRWQDDGEPFNEQKQNILDCIYQDSRGVIWAGYFAWGLTIFDRTTGEFKPVALPNLHGETGEIHILCMLEDRLGFFWVGTSAGLYVRHPEGHYLAFSHFHRDKELARAHITRIFEDSRGNLWISTLTKGVYRMPLKNRDSMKFVLYKNRKEDPSAFAGSHVNCIWEDGSNRLWFGSDKGLESFDFEGDQFETEELFNERCQGSVVMVHGDASNNLWILHRPLGLIRYRPDCVQGDAIKVFGLADGLPFDQFNTLPNFPNTFHQGKNGRLYLGSAPGSWDGFLWFHPDSVYDNEKIPDLALTGFYVDNKPHLLDSSVSYKKSITLDHNQNFFSLEFASLNYVVPEKNQYACYLENCEQDWVYIGSQNHANYTGVPPGN